MSVITNIERTAAGLAVAGVSVGIAADAAGPADAAPPAFAKGHHVSGWWWAVGGLLVGAALMALILRYLPAARRRLRGEPAGSDIALEPQ